MFEKMDILIIFDFAMSYKYSFYDYELILRLDIVFMPAYVLVVNA